VTITTFRGIHMSQNKYMTWQLIAPPATRFYQMADGNFSMYFEKTKIKEMVAWAESQLEAFMRLEAFVEQQAEQEEKKEVAKAQKADELAVRAANISPNASKGHTPNMKTREAIAKVEANAKPRPKGMKPLKPMIAGNQLTTQEEVEAAIPELPKPKKLPDLSLVKDPGMRIALQQQRLVDQRNGVNREEKNEAPDEELVPISESFDEEEEITLAPESEEDIPATERPNGISVIDDSPY
jgi:hypothetical protein